MKKIRTKEITIVTESRSIDVRFVLLSDSEGYAVMEESETEITVENCYELNWECVQKLFDTLIANTVTPTTLRDIIDDKRKEQFLNYIK